jgi:hypothetical protein
MEEFLSSTHEDLGLIPALKASKQTNPKKITTNQNKTENNPL